MLWYYFTCGFHLVYTAGVRYWLAFKLRVAGAGERGKSSFVRTQTLYLFSYKKEYHRLDVLVVWVTHPTDFGNPNPSPLDSPSTTTAAGGVKHAHS